MPQETRSPVPCVATTVSYTALHPALTHKHTHTRTDCKRKKTTAHCRSRPLRHTQAHTHTHTHTHARAQTTTYKSGSLASIRHRACRRNVVNHHRSRTRCFHARQCRGVQTELAHRRAQLVAETLAARRVAPQRRGWRQQQLPQQLCRPLNFVPLRGCCRCCCGCCLWCCRNGCYCCGAGLWCCGGN